MNTKEKIAALESCDLDMPKKKLKPIRKSTQKGVNQHD
jgi:hypothetical protein